MKEDNELLIIHSEKNANILKRLPLSANAFSHMSYCVS